jgi:hypothetical protein
VTGSGTSGIVVFASAALVPVVQVGTVPGGQASLTCEFAIAGWAATQIELAEARGAYRACRREHQSACTAEQGRVRMLEQRLRLMRNYVNGYCRR